ncbi:hypothetical protein BDR04DRAFT_19084 [Suillus decipiens]|nr:hypothetical protein BDR04DRAFT_19084 [Suillus decipiens]
MLQINRLRSSPPRRPDLRSAQVHTALYRLFLRAHGSITNFTNFQFVWAFVHSFLVTLANPSHGVSNASFFEWRPFALPNTCSILITYTVWTRVLAQTGDYVECGRAHRTTLLPMLPVCTLVVIMRYLHKYCSVHPCF